jgi:hypothetical protein
VKIGPRELTMTMGRDRPASLHRFIYLRPFVPRARPGNPVVLVDSLCRVQFDTQVSRNEVASQEVAPHLGEAALPVVGVLLNEDSELEVGFVENGSKPLRTEDLLCLAKGLGVSPAAFFEGR